MRRLNKKQPLTLGRMTKKAIMKFYVAVLLLLLCQMTPTASAKEARCESLADITKPNPELCICKESLSKLPITIPTGFVLTGACNFHRPYGEDVFGNYSFRGNALLSGTIELGGDFDAEEGGPYISFSAANKAPRGDFQSAINNFSFRNFDKAARQFRAPKLTRATPCWKAPVSLSLRTVVVEVGHGTDTEGTFAEDFQIQSIGAYVPCKNR